VGGKNVPRVIMDYSQKTDISAASLFAIGCNYSVPLDKWNLTDMACDYVYCGKNEVEFEIPGTLGLICDAEIWHKNKNRDRVYPLVNKTNLHQVQQAPLIFVAVSLHDLDSIFIEQLKTSGNTILVLQTQNQHGMAEQRAAFFRLMNAGCEVPVIVHRTYNALDEDQFMLYSSTDVGALLIDGLGDGIFLSAPDIAMQRVNSTAFGILQATRTRISKTEYISCPSCGRTLFDLQETTAKIRARTSHLKGVKIGIMGCIVNGPGEMADADYGYVGTGPGKITLYKEKNVVKKNVAEDRAVDELIALIKEGGDWVDVPELV
jgi:(E)-4-hydroxy-3-methylbut-2-enyl-diphosphate synthase